MNKDKTDFDEKVANRPVCLYQAWKGYVYSVEIGTRTPYTENS